MKGNFTPGANLTPEQRKRVLAFATCKGKNNDETLDNMAAFFEPRRPMVRTSDFDSENLGSNPSGVAKEVNNERKEK